MHHWFQSNMALKTRCLDCETCKERHEGYQDMSIAVPRVKKPSTENTNDNSENNTKTIAENNNENNSNDNKLDNRENNNENNNVDSMNEVEPEIKIEGVDEHTNMSTKDLDDDADGKTHVISPRFAFFFLILAF